MPCEACGLPVAAPLERCACGAPCFAWGAPPAGSLPCPRCGGALGYVELDASSLHVEQCARCLGSFIGTAEFGEALGRELAGEAVGLRRFVPLPPGKELPRQTLLETVRCPRCDAGMDRVRFAQRANLIVDVCPKHGLWLDAGEFVAVVNFARRRAQGDTSLGPGELADEKKWEEYERKGLENARGLGLAADAIAERQEQERAGRRRIMGADNSGGVNLLLVFDELVRRFPG